MGKCGNPFVGNYDHLHDIDGPLDDIATAVIALFDKMDVSCLCSYLLAGLCFVQLLRLIFSDCDLTLQWAAKFGKSPATLKGKVVWITGASSGIGEYLAYELASVGCRLVLSARREEELNRVKKECLTCGPVKEEDILVVRLDMEAQGDHGKAYQTVIDHFKKVDILVNNAGRSQRAAWVKTSLQVDREMLETNVLGTVSITKQVLPAMIERKEGHIVVMSSAAGKLGAPYSGSYTGSKHALQGYFESLRIEEYENNIKVSMICPGPVFSKLLLQATTENKGEVVGREMQTTEKRVSTTRCASLTAVAIANEIDEVWIALHPVLIVMYIMQYLPSIGRKLICKMGLKQLKKIREGK